MRIAAAVVACSVVACIAVACTAVARTVDAQAAKPKPLPSARLTVWDGAAWREWWRAGRAPARWSDSLSTATGLGALARWRAVAPGVEWAELRLAGSGEAWRTRAVLVRIDPSLVRMRLETAATRGAAAWTIDRAPASALVALNAGQFTGGSPWGWLVRDGRELLSPGRGPLAPAVVVDGDGRVSIVDAARIPSLRSGNAVAQAFQSYPALLLGDAGVPAALRRDGPRVDVAHRDARLALGVLRDGRVLVALTRFDALGGALDAAPFGLTTPEMAALMGALGARQAVALDGGISAQLLVRDPAGERRWPGMRAVPLGLVVERR